MASRPSGTVTRSQAPERRPMAGADEHGPADPSVPRRPTDGSSATEGLGTNGFLSHRRQAGTRT